MIKIRNIPPRSFSHVNYFPGCAGNPFDHLLHSLERIEKIPSFFIVLMLALLAFLGNLPILIKTRSLSIMVPLLFLFFISDWGLLALLSVTRRSFGPAKVVVLMLAILRTLFCFLPYPLNLIFECIGTLLIFYGFYYEPFHLDVHHETYITPKLSPGQHLRVIHVGDLHIERTTRREKMVLQKLDELSPDLILFSGDLINLSYLNDSVAQHDVRDFLQVLSARCGVYGVTGSPAVDLPELFPELIENTPMQWLNNQSVSVPVGSAKVKLYGVTCSHNPEKDDAVINELIKENTLPTDSFNILLYHSPDLAPHASLHGFDLQLSGHTHGGQVRLPVIGALYTGSLYQRVFESGRYLVNGMTLYITRGLGMEGAIAPRVRVLCPPELIVWDICGLD